MPLSHNSISKAAPKDKPYKLSDGFGLSLLINPNGGKKWRFLVLKEQGYSVADILLNLLDGKAASHDRGVHS